MYTFEKIIIRHLIICLGTNHFSEYEIGKNFRHILRDFHPRRVIFIFTFINSESSVDCGCYAVEAV